MSGKTDFESSGLLENMDDLCLESVFEQANQATQDELTSVDQKDQSNVSVIIVDKPLFESTYIHDIVHREPTNRDDEMRLLLENLRKKYSSNSKNLTCFPNNPRISENRKYIEFDTPVSEGRKGNIEWCCCGHCVIMPTNLESICCKEIENAIPYIVNNLCISQHEFFRIFCTCEDTVAITLRTVGDVKRPPSSKEKNRLFRKTAYRAFTAWVHGYLGMGNRRPIPSCAVRQVRAAFPDPNQEYMGYLPTNDSPAEFMAFE